MSIAVVTPTVPKRIFYADSGLHDLLIAALAYERRGAFSPCHRNRYQGDERQRRPVHRIRLRTSLAPAHKERVFRPFFTTTARRGLGLSLCSAIARLHGGTLRLENGAGGGVEATLTLSPLNRLEATG